MELQQSSTLSLNAFTLYPITLAPIKTCYQSQTHKILCFISGPYYDRSSGIDPIFSIKISSNASEVNSSKQNIVIQKIRQTLKNTIVKQKYQRMKFDINFDIIQNTSSNILTLYAPLINLLCYTTVLNGVEIKSLFTCCSLSLIDQKRLTTLTANNQENITQQSANKEAKSMVLGIQHLNNTSILSIWQGQFVFLHYQRLANTLLVCNSQINNFIRSKIQETYEQFN